MSQIKTTLWVGCQAEHGSDEQQGAQGILTLRHMQEARKGTHVAEELPHMEVDTVDRGRTRTFIDFGTTDHSSQTPTNWAEQRESEQ